MKNIKRIIYDIIQPDYKGSFASKLFDVFIMGLVFVSITSVFIMTFDVSQEVIDLLERIETYSLIIFSVEYGLRIWTANYLYPNAGWFRSRWKYMTSCVAIIDLISILPFLLPLVLPVSLLGLRAFRLIRLLRILKLHRYSEAFTSIWTVIKKKSHEMFAAMFFIFMLLIVASLLIYYAEHEAQPDKFPNAFSGLWWAVATLTTVGYGDIYPITAIGRILGAFIAIMGIGMVAIPSGILSAGFVEMIEKKKQPAKGGGVVVEQETAPDEDKKQFCPYCGKKLYCPCCGEKLYCPYCGKKQ